MHCSEKGEEMEEDAEGQKIKGFKSENVASKSPCIPMGTMMVSQSELNNTFPDTGETANGIAQTWHMECQ